MAFRVHLAAHLTHGGPDPELAEAGDTFFLETWAGALLSVWGSSSADLDWRLAKISRRHRTLALRATTEDDYRFRLVMFVDGQRVVQLARVYFEDFEEAMEHLTGYLESEDLSPDLPVGEEHHENLHELIGTEREQTWLLDVRSGVAPRSAYVKAGRHRAALVAGCVDSVGLTPDVDLLERFFTGKLSKAEIDAWEDWENFGDLLLFIQAIGLKGLPAHLESESQMPASAEEPDDVEPETEEELVEADRKSKRPFKRFVRLGCPLLVLILAGSGGLGMKYGGCWGGGGAILVLLLVVLLALRLFMGRLGKLFGGESLEDPGVDPDVLNRWRRLLSDWRDLVYRCGEVVPDGGAGPRRVGIFDALYSSSGVPVDPPGRKLLELMTTNETAVAPLAEEITALRRALLDAEIAGRDGEAERASYRALCERLLAGA